MFKKEDCWKINGTYVIKSQVVGFNASSRWYDWGVAVPRIDFYLTCGEKLCVELEGGFGDAGGEWQAREKAVAFAQKFIDENLFSA
jgi:hypothetical protein